jgi:hypothetical protein
MRVSIIQFQSQEFALKDLLLNLLFQSYGRLSVKGTTRKTRNRSRMSETICGFLLLGSLFSLTTIWINVTEKGEGFESTSSQSDQRNPSSIEEMTKKSQSQKGKIDETFSLFSNSLSLSLSFQTYYNLNQRHEDRIQIEVSSHSGPRLSKSNECFCQKRILRRGFPSVFPGLLFSLTYKLRNKQPKEKKQRNPIHPIDQTFTSVFEEIGSVCF